MIKASVCVFDAYGTLFDLGDFAGRFRTDLGDKAEELMALWRRKQLEYSWLRTAMGRHTDFWHVTGESLDYAMAALGLADLGLRARLMEAWLSPKAYPEAAGVLAGLQERGIKTAILSNGSPSMLVAGMATSGLVRLVDKVLSVEAAGVYKPHPSVYRVATQAFDIEPSQVCFVSGNGWDIAGSACFGFNAVWVNRAKAQREHLPAAPCAEIFDLAGLAPLIE